MLSLLLLWQYVSESSRKVAALIVTRDSLTSIPDGSAVPVHEMLVHL